MVFRSKGNVANRAHWMAGLCFRYTTLQFCFLFSILIGLALSVQIQARTQHIYILGASLSKVQAKLTTFCTPPYNVPASPFRPQSIICVHVLFPLDEHGSAQTHGVFGPATVPGWDPFPVERSSDGGLLFLEKSTSKIAMMVRLTI